MILTACYQNHYGTPLFLSETHLKEFRNKHVINTIADSSLLFLTRKQISQETTYDSQEARPFIREIDPALVKKSIKNAYIKIQRFHHPSKYKLIEQQIEKMYMRVAVMHLLLHLEIKPDFL